MLKKLFLSLMVAGLAITSIAANNTNSLFNAKEFGFSGDIGYVSNDYPDTKTASTVGHGGHYQNAARSRTVTTITPNDDYGVVARFGAFFFPIRYLGASIMLPVYTTRDSFELNTADLSLIGRLPVANNVALYSKLGTSYQWRNEEFDYFGAIGAEWRFNPKLGLYSEVNYQIKDFDSNNLKNGQTTLRLGISYVF